MPIERHVSQCGAAASVGGHARAVCLVVVLLASGCQSSGTRYDAESLARRYDASEALAGDPQLRSAAAALPAPWPAAVQPVSYEPDRAGADSSLVPEPLPDPGAGPFSRSDLTLIDLEGIALQNSPALAEAGARIAAAQGRWLQAGLPPNPVLGYSGQQLGSHGEAEQQGISVGQEFVTGGKLKIDRQIACWEIQRLQSVFEATRLRVLTDVRITYYDVLIAQRRRELTSELVRISEQAVQAAQALFRGEEVSEADPLRARVDADTAHILLQNAMNQHVEAWRRLTAVLGMPEMTLQYLDGELRPEDPGFTWREALDRVLTESPEVAAALADVEAAAWSISRARAEVVPNIEVEAVVQDDRATGSNNANLIVSVPIPIVNRNQGGIQSAEAEAASARQAVDRVALDLQARLASAFQRYASDRNQVDQYSREGGILANSQRTLELIRAGYQAGEFGVLDLLTAQRTYFQTNLAYLDSLRGLSESIMEIRGLLLRDALSG